MPTAKTFCPVLPQLRATQQAERCGGALPFSSLALPPLLSQGRRPWDIDYEDDEMAAVFGGNGSQPLRHKAANEFEQEDTWATTGQSSTTEDWDDFLDWRPRPPDDQVAKKKGGHAGKDRHGRRMQRRRGAPSAQTLGPSRQVFHDSQKLLSVTFSGENLVKIQAATSLYSAYTTDPGANQGQSWQRLLNTSVSPQGSPAHGSISALSANSGSVDVRTSTRDIVKVAEKEHDALLKPVDKRYTIALDVVIHNDIQSKAPSRDIGPTVQGMLPKEFIESTVKAFHSTQGMSAACDLPDVHRVVWRGGELQDAADERAFEALELARHRRDKLREAGDEQRLQARDNVRKWEEKERRLVSARREQKRAEIESAEKNRLLRLRKVISPKSMESEGADVSKSRRSSRFASATGDSSASSPQSPKARRGGRPMNGMAGSEAVLRGKPDDQEKNVLNPADLIRLKNRKNERLSTLTMLHRSRRKQQRLGRLREARHAEFKTKPEKEQIALRGSFVKADVTSSDALDLRQLRRALEGLGLASKNEAEKKEIKLICDEVLHKCGVMCEVDFFTFCSEAVPRTREKLKELRRGPLLQDFHMYDADDSGALDQKECDHILNRNFTFSLDEKGLRAMRDSFTDAIKKAVQASGPEAREDHEIDFQGFEFLMSTLQEHYQRILLEREADIMDEEDLKQDDVSEHVGELVSLYDSFSRGDFDGNAGMDRDELRPLLLEYGLYPRSKEGQHRIEQIFDELDTEDIGSLPFKEFLEIVRGARQVFKFGQASDLHTKFARFDREGDGAITVAEVSKLLDDLGLKPRNREDQQEMKRILDSLQTGTGKVAFDTFQTLVLRITEFSNTSQRRRERQCAADLKFGHEQVAELRDAFHALDIDDLGILPIEKLRTALDLLRKGMPAERLQEIVHSLDTAGLGGLPFEQFLHFMHVVTHTDEGRT